jgi:amino acid transporter
MVNPDRDDVDQETEQASNPSPESDPPAQPPTRRKPIIKHDAHPTGAVEPDVNGDRGDLPRKIKPPRKSGPKPVGDLEGMQQVQGKLAGDRYVRVVRQQRDDFARAGPGHLVATEESMKSKGSIARGFSKAKRVLIGAPIATAQAGHERLTKFKALAVLSSDALSSVAYATEEILRVLLVAGGLAYLDVSLPIAAAIIVLLIIVGTSYRQTIKAYPTGGGSYIVAKDNLGDGPALVAGAALLVAYLLTVAVSIAASVAAMVSAFPELNSHRVGLGVLLVLLVTILNLRGIRESGSIFAVPTYLFLIGMAVMIGAGMVRTALNGFEAEPVPSEAHELAGAGALSLFVVLRAFSSGCAALTGVEAISDGVPAFKPPEWKNARTTLTIMISILAVTFAGITFLAHQFGAYPMESHSSSYETVVSQIARHTFGGANAGYYYIQFATMAILVLGANTAYSDFPRLSYFLARDRFMPRQFTFRGDRLAFSTGIVTLGLLAMIVLTIFDGEVEPLIPLYAVGVFISFTISQFAMFTRWQRRRESGWQMGRVVNLVGATATAMVATIVGVSRFREGAWITGVIILVLIVIMRSIHRHYETATRELATSTPLDPDQIIHTVIVPIASVNRIARQTLAYARSISDNVTAVHVTEGEEEIQAFREQWSKLELEIPLVIIESPYRQLVGPLLKYIDEIDRQRPDDTLTVVLPEFIARHWWEHVLHNQTALRLKAALLFRPGTVVTSVPYHLERT